MTEIFQPDDPEAARRELSLQAAGLCFLAALLLVGVAGWVEVLTR